MEILSWVCYYNSLRCCGVSIFSYCYFSPTSWIIHSYTGLYFQFGSVQSLSRVRHFATPWTAACQASLSITNSRSSPKLMSIKSVMSSSHLSSPSLPAPNPSQHLAKNKTARFMLIVDILSESFMILDYCGSNMGFHISRRNKIKLAPYSRITSFSDFYQ